METTKLDNTLLKNLTPEEQAEVFSILKEFSETGESLQFNKLLYDDYREIPVDVETFIRDRKYLGQGLTDDEGRFTVFPFWVETLKQIFPNNLETTINTLVLSGGIGLGKSFMAVICILYLLYRMLCLKDPYKHYGLQPIDHITFSFINITLDAAKGVAWAKCQELLQTSPWFLENGVINKSTANPIWSPKPESGIELIVGSQPRHVLGRAVFASFEDEISFQINQDIEKQKAKAKQLVSSIDARMQSRFMKGEKLPTLHILASSKRTDQSFLETYIDMKKKNESKTTLVIDKPQWVIRTDKDSPNKFKVAVGNKFLESEVVPLNATEADLQHYRDKGYTLLEVPMGYYEQFIDDLDIALTDIAGISTSNAMSYISGSRWAAIKNTNIKNPFSKEILVVGDDPKDLDQYYNYFDLNEIPKEYKNKPLYIHLDMSLSGDKTGIAGVWIIGKKPPEEGKPASKELFYQLAFSVAIKAPKGRQVSFEKNRQFIYWLQEQNFNIKGISSDTYQSADMNQALSSKGFDYSIISVDRVKDRVCEPYQTLKSAIYEERLRVYPTTLLTDEIIGLLRDSNGKIDHSPAGINSKDTADALCGALYNASLHTEEYAYNHGETLDDFLTANITDFGDSKQQVIVDFERELQKLGNISSLNNIQNNKNEPSDDSAAAFDGMLWW